MSRVAVVFMMIFLAGCCAKHQGTLSGLQTITYETGACYGTCPVYLVEVHSDGTGQFTGINHTNASGVHNFTITPAEFLALELHLAPHRPSGNLEITPGHATCQFAPTDLPSVEVQWMGSGTPDRLEYYYGCNDPQHAQLSNALQTTPDLLPISNLIGP